MKVLLTGAFGNLGIMTVRALFQKGYTIRCLDIDNDKNRSSANKLSATLSASIEHIFGDIRDAALLEKAVSGVDAVIHLAAVLPPVTDNHPKLAWAINVEGTEKLIAAVVAETKKGAKAPLIVYASSVTVFGFQQDKKPPRTVTDPVGFTDNYTEHKLACEALLRDSGLPWSALRIGVSVDSRTTATDLATLRKLFSVKADNRLEYVHPADVALALANVVDCTQARNKVLLIGGGQSCQIRQHEFLSGLFSAVGITLPLSIHGKQVFYTDWMDTSESQSLLAYQQTSYQDYLQEMEEKMRLLRYVLFPLRPLLLVLIKYFVAGR